MDPETLFTLCSILVLPAWALLIFAPRWEWTERLIGSCAISLFLSGLYLCLALSRLGAAKGGFGSLAQVALLFGDPWILLAGWVHYLAFDLFIGSWEARDARRLSIPRHFLIPCLILTFLLGPIGFLAYVALRSILKKGFLLGADL